MTATDLPLDRYRIRIQGHLDPAWSEWFDSLTITQEQDGTSTLIGRLVDQSALYGLLSRLRDLGATLLSVERLPEGPPDGGNPGYALEKRTAEPMESSDPGPS